MTPFRQALLLAGVALVLAALFWPYLPKLPLGRLPGDIVVRRGGATFYFPLTTMIVVSIVITLALRLFRK